jgi:signal transduction histidine kinase
VIQRLRSLLRKEETRFLSLDVNQVIREIAALVHTEAVLRNLVIDVELAPALRPVRGDRVQLQQVLLNLILNAADALSGIDAATRTVTIRSEPVGVEVRVTVVDNGPGIAAKDLERVFDPFWSTKPGGMGIGLAVCQSIVAAHHGQITAANDANGGALFCVILPARHPA